MQQVTNCERVLLSEITYNLFFVRRLYYSLRLLLQYLIGERR